MPRIAAAIAAGCVLILSSAAAQPQSATRNDPPQRLDAGQLMADLRTLAADDMEGRATGSPGGLKARDYIRRRFIDEGLKSYGGSYLQPFSFTQRRGNRRYEDCANVIGHIPGSRGSETIVISAHYDHLGRDGETIFNGADDNASGVATLLAMARHFRKHPPSRTLVFVAFDAEELGLEGARYFVEHLPFDPKDLRLNVNMDMLSVSAKGELYAAGAHHFPALRPVLSSLPARTGAKLLLGHDRPELGRDDWSNQSDHGAFFARGIPFVYFGVEDHANYHRPGDRVENIHPEFFRNAAEVVLSAVAALDAADALPPPRQITAPAASPAGGGE